MSKKFSLIIFTDLDGSLLHRDNFKFDVIKDYIKDLIDEGIIIIPNTSKTEKEIEEFMKELGSNLPFISENGSSIYGLNLINSNFPNKIILSRVDVYHELATYRVRTSVMNTALRDWSEPHQYRIPKETGV